MPDVCRCPLANRISPRINLDSVTKTDQPRLHPLPEGVAVKMTALQFRNMRPKMKAAASLLLSFLAITHGGFAMAIEEPAFEVLSKEADYEIRQYRPFIVAETYVDGDMSEASNKGFRLIADYIFGNNESAKGSPDKAAEKIAMTAPVTVEPAAASAKIAMTAPVTVEPQSGGGGKMTQAKRWKVHFVMPAEYSMATLPKPKNPAVSLREVPGKLQAVLVFSGLAWESTVQEKTDELVAWLGTRQITALGAPQLARYNPPWTLPFLRRNEILVEIARQR